MANAPTVKEASDTNPGTAVKYGVPDIVHIIELLKGTHATEAIQQSAIDGLVDAIAGVAQGTVIKSPCRVATTAAQVLATDFENGDTIDGVVLATNDRVLIKDQAAGAENGIYTVNASGAPTRATDFDEDSEVLGTLVVYIAEGTANADSGFMLTTDTAIIVGTTALVFQQFTGLGQVTAGTGLTKTGNTLDITALGITDAEIAVAAAIAITKLANGTANQIVKTNTGGTALEHGLIADANIDAGAAIALGKLATDPLARANHTGTQLASTISDLATIVKAYRLDEFAAPTAAVSLGSQNATNVRKVIRTLDAEDTALDFDDEDLASISIVANTTFTGSNYGTGKVKELRIITDGTLRTLAFPAGWVFVGAKPADQAASKTGLLKLTCYGAAEADVVAEYAVQT